MSVVVSAFKSYIIYLGLTLIFYLSVLLLFHVVQLRRDFLGSLFEILHLTLNLLSCFSFFIQLLLQLWNVGLSRQLRILAIWGGNLWNGINSTFVIIHWVLPHSIHSFHFFSSWLWTLIASFFHLSLLFILCENIITLWVTESRFSKNARMLAIWLSVDLWSSALLRKHGFLTSCTVFWSCLNSFIKSSILNFVLFMFLISVRANSIVSESGWSSWIHTITSSTSGISLWFFALVAINALSFWFTKHLCFQISCIVGWLVSLISSTDDLFTNWWDDSTNIVAFWWRIFTEGSVFSETWIFQTKMKRNNKINLRISKNTYYSITSVAGDFEVKLSIVAFYCLVSWLTLCCQARWSAK